MMRNRRGFTLIELLIAIAVIAVIVTLAAPSFSDFILRQRVKSVSAQVVTDLQFARSEAAARSVPVRVRFLRNVPNRSCYVLYVGNARECNCTDVPVCPVGAQEIRTAGVDPSLRVRISTAMNPEEFSYDPATGAMVFAPDDAEGGGSVEFVVNTAAVKVNNDADVQRSLRAVVNMSGRPGVCTPVGSTMGGTPC